MKSAAVMISAAYMAMTDSMCSLTWIEIIEMHVLPRLSMKQMNENGFAIAHYKSCSMQDFALDQLPNHCSRGDVNS